MIQPPALKAPLPPMLCPPMAGWPYKVQNQAKPMKINENRSRG